MIKRTPEQLEKQSARILAVLAKRGPSTAEEICKGSRLSIVEARLPLRKLLDTKQAKRHGRGKTRSLQYAAR